MKLNFDDVKKSNAAFALVGAIVGYASFIISSSFGIPEINILLVAAAIFATKVVLEKLANIKQPRNWWFSNGVLLAILMWIIVWTIFFNIGLTP